MVCHKNHVGRHTSETESCSNYNHEIRFSFLFSFLASETCAAMMNIAPPDYERYAVLASQFQKYGIETVVVKPPKRVAEPAGAVSANVARQRGTAAWNMTDGKVIPQASQAPQAKAVSGSYPGYRMNATGPDNLVLLKEASNGTGDAAGSLPIRSAREVSALYERTNTMLR